MYGTSPKGWINTITGSMTIFSSMHACGEYPLLLLMNGHSSHNLHVRLAKENDVIILCLPPHTSADSQPLDVAVFRSLKVEWSKACHDWLDMHPNRVITKFQSAQ